jgi:hypothetical protein
VAGDEAYNANSDQIIIKSGKEPVDRSKIPRFASRQERKASLLCKKLRENI